MVYCTEKKAIKKGHVFETSVTADNKKKEALELAKNDLINYVIIDCCWLKDFDL